MCDPVISLPSSNISCLELWGWLRGAALVFPESPEEGALKAKGRQTHREDEGV